MSTLYEIDRSILECLDFESGEILDLERFENLQLERNQKIENIALLIKNLQSDALAYKAEKDAFDEREKAATKKAEQLKSWLSGILNGEKFSTAKCVVSFRKSEKVEILDMEKIPKKYLTKKVTVTPDKNAIKEILKDGKKVNGCCLIQNQNIQIK